VLVFSQSSVVCLWRSLSINVFMMCAMHCVCGVGGVLCAICTHTLYMCYYSICMFGLCVCGVYECLVSGGPVLCVFFVSFVLCVYSVCMYIWFVCVTTCVCHVYLCMCVC
jgi:hypothetical protein